MKHITNLLSIGFGKFASKEFPAGIQGVINNAYVNLLGLDMGEFQKPYKYRSLNNLFTRKLESPREFDKKEEAVISPCDSLATYVGKADGNKVYQIKGIEYSFEELLTDIDKESVAKIHNSDYINLYLSPKDYHRYHTPCDLKVEKLVYVPAKLYPVNFFALKYIKNLFCKNERVILQCKTSQDKTVILVLIGALNVGKMAVNFEPKVETNNKIHKSFSVEYDNLTLKKGEELGYFKMGSTILLFAEQNTLDFTVSSNEKVKFSQTIAKLL